MKCILEASQLLEMGYDFFLEVNLAKKVFNFIARMIVSLLGLPL